jgi:hypothetical protein
MHWTVEQLVEVMAPPSGRGDNVDWEQIRDVYGVTFPADYRSFVETYGGGEIDGHIGISTPPVEGSVYGDVLEGAPFVSGRRHPEGQPSYPDPDGVLCWGSNGDGDDIFWRCSSENPDEWTILVFARQVASGEERWKSFNGGMVEVLLASIRDGHPSLFSDPGTPSAGSVFQGWRDMVSSMEF